MLTTVIGYAATVVGTSLMLPQVYKSYRTKSVADVSWGMVIMYFLNCALWLSYALLISATPLAITNALALVVSAVQATLKLKYSK